MAILVLGLLLMMAAALASSIRCEPHLVRTFDGTALAKLKTTQETKRRQKKREKKTMY